MAKSKCFICDSTEFELAEVSPKNIKTNIVVLQCASCGTIFGALDQYDLGSYVKAIAREMGVVLKEQTKKTKNI